MFERASQVNARFGAGSVRPAEVVAALRGLGLTEDQITVLERTLPPGDQAPLTAPGMLARLRVFLGGEPARPAPPPRQPDVQIMVHMGKEDTLSDSVQAVFRRFGAAGIEHFAPANSPQRHFGPTGIARDAPVPAPAASGRTPMPPLPADTAVTGEARWDDDGGAHS